MTRDVTSYWQADCTTNFLGDTSRRRFSKNTSLSLQQVFMLASVKRKRTLLELNFYQPYPSSWGEWILSLLVYGSSQNMKLGIFTGSPAVDGKEMCKKCDARAKLLFYFVKLLLVWLSRRRRIFNLLLFTTHYDDRVKNRIFSGQIQLLLLIASQTFFRLIGSSFRVSG